MGFVPSQLKEDEDELSHVGGEEASMRSQFADDVYGEGAGIVAQHSATSNRGPDCGHRAVSSELQEDEDKLAHADGEEDSILSCGLEFMETAAGSVPSEIIPPNAVPDGA